MRFKEYVQIRKDTENLISLIEFRDNYNMIDEGIGEKLNGILKKLGIHAHASEAGIIPTILKGGKMMAQLFWYAMKAMGGDNKAKEKVKEIANTEITKEQVLDFLLRIDTITLHAITGPIHMIDALTGWHIWANVKKAGNEAIDRAKRVIAHLRNIVKEVEGTIKKKVSSWVEEIQSLFGITV